MVVILWYSAPSLLSRLIRRVTRSPYSHVALMHFDTEVNDWVLYEALGRGVVRREGDDAVQRSQEAVATKWLKVERLDRKQMRFWLEQHVGRSYSFIGFLTAGLTSVGLPAPVLALNGEYICSGLVATALQIAGCFNPLLDPRLETPQSLAARLEAESV